jgi:hypothetical protein
VRAHKQVSNNKGGSHPLVHFFGSLTLTTIAKQTFVLTPIYLSFPCYLPFDTKHCSTLACRSKTVPPLMNRTIHSQKHPSNDRRGF